MHHTAPAEPATATVILPRFYQARLPPFISFDPDLTLDRRQHIRLFELPRLVKEVGRSDLARGEAARRRGDVYDRPVREVWILKGVVVVVGLARSDARVYDDIVAEHIVVGEARRVDQTRDMGGCGRKRTRDSTHGK